jgi:hypothetical protein
MGDRTMPAESTATVEQQVTALVTAAASKTVLIVLDGTIIDVACLPKRLVILYLHYKYRFMECRPRALFPSD